MIELADAAFGEQAMACDKFSEFSLHACDATVRPCSIACAAFIYNDRTRKKGNILWPQCESSRRPRERRRLVYC